MVELWIIKQWDDKGSGNAMHGKKTTTQGLWICTAEPSIWFSYWNLSVPWYLQATVPQTLLLDFFLNTWTKSSFRYLRWNIAQVQVLASDHEQGQGIKPDKLLLQRSSSLLSQHWWQLNYHSMLVAPVGGKIEHDSTCFLRFLKLLGSSVFPVKLFGRSNV